MAEGTVDWFITVTLRAVPFGMKNVIKESALLADVGRWMLLCAIVILADYCLAAIKITAPAYGLTEMIGVVVTVAIHLWRRNPVLSIVTGTAAV
jgi:branched-subunit amino acid transport protein AzlD